MNSKNSNKSFGLLFFLVFSILGLWPLLNGNLPNYIILIIGLFFLILGLINSNFLTPLNRSWIKFGELLGKFFAPSVMLIIYFMVLTPLSFLIRMFGKDLLKLKFLKENNSYWTKKDKDIGSMDKQF